MLTINFLPVFILLVLFWGIFRIIIYKRNGMTNIFREIVIEIFFIYILALISVTFFPMRVILYAWKFSFNLIPFNETIDMIKGASLRTSLINIIGNLILLLPIGFFIPLLNRNIRKLSKITLIGFFVSLSIELLQLVLMIRIFDVDDLIFNTVSVILGYIIYLGMAKLKKIQKLQSKIEKENRINVLTMASIPVVIIALIISGFWFVEYFKITYPIDKSAENSIYTAISEEVVYTNDYEGYYSILTTDSIHEKQITMHGFRKTPFNRAVPYVTGEPLNLNSFGNSFSLAGTSNIDGMMYYAAYGYNSMADSILMQTGGSDYKKSVPQGYFIVAFRTKISGKFNIIFLNDDAEDITDKFDIK